MKKETLKTKKVSIRQSTLSVRMAQGVILLVLACFCMGCGPAETMVREDDISEREYSGRKYFYKSAWMIISTSDYGITAL